MTIFIIVAAIIGYGFGAGVTYAGLRAAGFNEASISESTFFGTLLWPLVLPALIGVLTVRRLLTPKRAALPEARVLELGDDER